MKKIIFTLLFLLSATAQAADFYADGSSPAGCSNGSKTYRPVQRDCSGGTATVYTGTLGLQNAVNAAGVSDTIYVRGFSGTYIGSGASDGNGPNNYLWVSSKSGTSSARFKIWGYNNELPVIVGFTGEPGYPNWLHFKDLIIDGSTATQPYMKGLHFMTNYLFENGEIRNVKGHGINAVGPGIVLNAHVHHNGLVAPTVYAGNCDAGAGGPCHGWYGDTITVDGGEWNNNYNYAIHCRPNCDNTIVRNVRVHHNGTVGVGLINTDGNNPHNNTVYNVITYNNGSFGVGIGSWPVTVYGVTSINNGGGNGICVGNPYATVRNSIVLDGLSANNCVGGAGDWTSSLTASNNITSASGNPIFADPPNGDFHLCSGVGVPHANCKGPAGGSGPTGNCPATGSTGAITSPIDQGCDLGYPYNVDIVGTARPQGSKWDIGAYEAVGPLAPPSTVAVLLFGFNEGSGTTLTDSSGYNNNGSFTTGVTWSNP